MVDIFLGQKKVSVIGAARSGLAAAKLLKRKGYDVFLSDLESLDKVNIDTLNEIKAYSISFEFGGHSNRVFDADFIVVSPGVPQTSPVIQKAIALGIEVYSEIEVASWFCKGKIIAITGTNGKTTTATLTGKIFEDAGFKTFICGNIGIAFSDIVDQTDEKSVVVLETSSFQLDNIKNFKPFISVFLNITPDHLDRYDNFDKYYESKIKIAKNQNKDNYFVFNYDDDLVRKSAADVNASISAFSLNNNVKNNFPSGAYINNNDLIYFYYMDEEHIIDTQKLVIKGEHNLYNSMASVISAKIFGIEKNYIKKTLENFKGVEHRLEFVRELEGVKYYNDSKATNINSVWYAIKGFNEPIVLILGGKDKGNDYSLIEKDILVHCKHIVAIGSSADKIYSFFNGKIPVSKADSMEQAVEQARNKAIANDVVLLSPACASFDMFDNFEHRGNIFKKIVNSLK